MTEASVSPKLTWVGISEGSIPAVVFGGKSPLVISNSATHVEKERGKKGEAEHYLQGLSPPEKHSGPQLSCDVMPRSQIFMDPAFFKI